MLKSKKYKKTNRKHRHLISFYVIVMVMLLHCMHQIVMRLIAMHPPLIYPPPQPSAGPYNSNSPLSNFSNHDASTTNHTSNHEDSNAKQLHLRSRWCTTLPAIATPYTSDHNFDCDLCLCHNFNCVVRLQCRLPNTTRMQIVSYQYLLLFDCLGT